MSTPEYRLAPAGVPAIGMGLYTRRPYHKSELIFTEVPLVRVPYKSSQPFMKQLWRHVANGISSHPIVNAFKGMSRYDQKDFLRLHNSRRMFLTRADYCPPSLDTDERISGPTCAFELLGIYLTNFFFLHEDFTGVFKSLSRVNHACAANAYLVWDRTNGEMRVVAASTIVSAGTEITIDYSEKFAKQGMFKMLENIREHCRYFYGFWCRCKFCLDNLSQGSIQEITPEQEREMISFHLDEVEEKLLLRQEERCWEIKELWSGDLPASSRDTRPMGELGMFATRRISRGEPIHGESPIFTLEFHQDQLKGTYIPSVVKAVRDLDLADRDTYLALGMRDPRVSGFSVKNHHGPSDINRLKEIFLANAICLPEFCEKGGHCEWGVFQDLSRVNHSCMPNSVGLTHNRKLRGTGQCQHWLHARRDIEPGEEITICYVETICAEADVTVRARALKDRFICWCQRCVHGRQGTSRTQQDTHFDGSEIPEEHLKVWMERINALPVAISDQVGEQHLCRKMKRKATQHSLVSGDVLIELNSISKQGQIFCAAKKAGRSIGNGIGSLPFILDDARQVVLSLGKRKRSQDRKETLQRRIKFTDSSCTLEGGETPQLRGKGKHAADWPPSTDWATMAAIVLRHNPEEASWGFGDNSPFGRNNSINSALGSDFRSIYPASTSTRLWESAGGRINQSQKAISVLHQGDPGLSDQMLRLGTEPTAERLRRTHNLALNHDHMGPERFTDNSRSAHYVNQSDGASDISSNSAVLRNEIYAALAAGESSTTDYRTFNTGSTGRVGNLAGSASSSTVTVIRRPTREGSVNGEDVSPVTAYPVARTHERYRGTSYTLDNGFLGPRSLCTDVGGEGLGSRSSGLSIRHNTGIETVTSRGQLPIRGTYQAPDGNYNTSRTDQDRRSSGGGQFRAPSRRVQSGPLPPRSSSQSFSAVPHHPMRGRGPPSGSSYTYGHGDQRDQRTLSHERNWPTGNAGSIGRHTAPRSHKSGRQQFSGPGSDGAVRDTRPKMMENYRLSSGNQPGGAEDHTRQGQFRDGASVGERGVDSSDQRYQRPRSMAESFHGSRGIEEPLEQGERIPEDIEQLAQRARNLLNRARTNIALPVSAPEGPVDSGVGVQDTSESCLDSIARMIEHQLLPGAVDSEEFPKVVEISACVRAPMLDTKSLHWKRSEFPEDNSPQSPIDNRDTGDVGDVLVSQKVNAQTNQRFPTNDNRFSLGCDNLPESNPTVYYEAHEGFANLELDLSPAQVHDGRLLEKGDTPNNWLPAVTSQVGGLFDELRPRLIENDNPHAPARPQPERAVTK